MPRVTLNSLRERLAGHEPRRIIDRAAHQAAVALVLAPGSVDGSGLQLLFIKRADHPGDPWSGQMALPGGRHDPTDADLRATAVREAREEVGIDLEAAFPVGELDDVHPRTPTLPPVVVRPFVFGLPAQPLVRPSREVAVYVWADLEGLLERPALDRIEVPPLGRSFPAYRIGQHHVWGMTERILTPFLELAR